MLKLIHKVTGLQEKAVYHLFEKKIERKQTLFKRKHDREMGDDEIKSYKFRLFTSYSVILVVPVILMFSVI